MKSEIERLRSKIAPLQARIYEIEQKRKAAKNKKLIGKCFKFHNSYGTDRPQWWLYGIVTGVGEFWPTIFTFQITCEGEVIIKHRDHFSESSSWLECSRPELDEAWRAVVQKVNAQQF